MKTVLLSVGIKRHMILDIRQLCTNSDSFSPLEYFEKNLRKFGECNKKLMKFTLPYTKALTVVLRNKTAL
jgi:hypothetical protein